MKRLSKFWGDEAGNQLLEYALTLVLLGVGLMSIVGSLGIAVRDVFFSAVGSGS